MKHAALVPLVLTLVLLGAEVRAAEPPANLITNGDFEAGPAGEESKGKLPPGWQTALSYDARSLEISTETRPGSKGKQSLCIRGTADYNGGGVSSDFIALDAGKALRLSGWYKPGNAKTGPAGFYFGVYFFDKDRKPVLMNKQYKQNYTHVNWSSKVGDWYYCEMTYPPTREEKDTYGNELPPGVVFFKVALFTLTYPHVGWFDDIEARAMTPEELKAPAPAAAPAEPKPVAAASAQDIAAAPWMVAWKGDTDRGRTGGNPVDAAAQELAKRMSQVLGVTIPAVPWDKAGAGRVILVTEAQFAPPDVAKSLEGKRLDAFTIKYPCEVDGRTVCLLAGHDSYDYDYPVYYFLTRFMDVHWVGPGELGVVLTPNPKWTMPEKIDAVENPDYEMRLWSGDKFTSRPWLARSQRMGFHHALGHVFSPDKWAEKYPDVYPLIDGKRYIPKKEGGHYLGGWQPCTANPKSIEIAADAVVSGLAKDKRFISVSLSVNDGAGNTCECDLCRAQDAPEDYVPGQRPNLSNRFFAFYNAVAEKAVAQNPNAYIAVLGYGPCKVPPTKVKVHPRIMIFQVNATPESLRKWKDAGATPNLYMWLWDGGFLGVRPSLRGICGMIQSCREMGGIGLYSEIIPNWVVSAPKFYVLAQVLWDTKRDPDKVLDEYLRLTYGPQAATPVRRFFDRWYEIYDRRPEAERYDTSWGWRNAEQFKLHKREDLAVFDVALAEARAATMTPEQRQRFEYLDTYYQLARINADQYLTGRELGDAAWLAAQTPEALLKKIEAALPLTAQFDALWKTKFATDETGWLLEQRKGRDADAMWNSFMAQMRAMVAGGCDTAIDDAVRSLVARRLKDGTKAQAVAWCEGQIKARPALAVCIGPAINELKGIAPEEVLPNGDFAKGAPAPGDLMPGKPPAVEGWDFYDFYGMVKGAKSLYKWVPNGGRDGKAAVAMGEGNYPEMKGILALEAGHRYELSFWYKTENRDRNSSLRLYFYKGALASPRDIKHDSIFQYVTISLEPTNGEWKSVKQTLMPAETGTYVIELASYYQKAGGWTWFDDIHILKVW